MTILIALDEATLKEETGPEVAKALREAADHVERTWPGMLPGPGGGPTVVALRHTNGALFGTATFGTLEKKP
jgi:hypothetical protein